jgi:hypothetical protein
MATMQQLVPLDDPERWAAVLDRLPHVPAHTWDHVAAFQSSSGCETWLYVREDEGEVVAICPLAVRGASGERDAYTPYGMGGFATRATVADLGARYRELALEQGWVATYVLQSPLLPPVADLNGDEVRAGPELYVLDLRPAQERLLADMAGTRRSELRRWESAPLPLVTDRGEITAFLAREAEAFFARRGATSVYRFTSETWHRLLRSRHVLPLAVAVDGELASATVVSAAGRHAEYLFNVSTDEGPGFGAPLLWEAIKRLRQRGVEQLNLGGGVRPDDGIAAFKRRFGARRVIAHHLRMVHRPDVFAVLCRRHGLAPDAPFFPPYRRSS